MANRATTRFSDNRAVAHDDTPVTHSSHPLHHKDELARAGLP
jgi:hypothetical protein